ncbi:hypothetical protein PIB30_017038 [Stylosanthes scabra]|uniref:Uncharacterized protein n=1 Tax=Stylosanthes scabra TaxID=79078 RepID=A0ABU6R7U1_9FABA|nr:hypothetical protein [Stylosanthes scabra]
MRMACFNSQFAHPPTRRPHQRNGFPLHFAAAKGDMPSATPTTISLALGVKWWQNVILHFRRNGHAREFWFQNDVHRRRIEWHCNCMSISLEHQRNGGITFCHHFNPGAGEMVAGVAEGHVTLGSGKVKKKSIFLMGTMSW